MSTTYIATFPDDGPKRLLHTPRDKRDTTTEALCGESSSWVLGIFGVRPDDAFCPECEALRIATLESLTTEVDHHAY